MNWKISLVFSAAVCRFFMIGMLMGNQMTHRMVAFCAAEREFFLEGQEGAACFPPSQWLASLP